MCCGVSTVYAFVCVLVCQQCMCLCVFWCVSSVCNFIYSDLSVTCVTLRVLVCQKCICLCVFWFANDVRLGCAIDRKKSGLKKETARYVNVQQTVNLRFL